MPTSKKDIGRYLGALKEDAVKDFLKEHPEAAAFSKDEAKFVMNPGSKGFAVFTVVMDRMQKSKGSSARRTGTVQQVHRKFLQYLTGSRLEEMS
ncbi:MAG: hypothetical protein MJ061_01080 [Mailhella sp.]|nr:hypothetical protein [Mailhella sp.]